MQIKFSLLWVFGQILAQSPREGGGELGGDAGRFAGAVDGDQTFKRASDFKRHSDAVFCGVGDGVLQTPRLERYFPVHSDESQKRLSLGQVFREPCILGIELKHLCHR